MPLSVDVRDFFGCFDRIPPTTVEGTTTAEACLLSSLLLFFNLPKTFVFFGFDLNKKTDDGYFSFSSHEFHLNGSHKNVKYSH